MTTVEAETMEELQECVRAIDEEGDFEPIADFAAVTERQIDGVNEIIGPSVLQPVARTLWAT